VDAADQDVQLPVRRHDIQPSVCAPVIATSIGTDNSVLVRENSIAVLPAAAFAAASRSGYLLPMLSAFCWFGQMTAQTLMNMMMASHMPTPMNTVFGSPNAGLLAAPKVSAWIK